VTGPISARNGDSTITSGKPELALPALAEHLAGVGVLGHVDRPNVGRQRPSEDDRLDHRPVDAVDRHDDALLAMGALDDEVIANVQLLLLGRVLAMDETSSPDEQRDQDRATSSDGGAFAT
jgi:hypothetical protein